MDADEITLSSPFKHIALSLSGGGIRAVGYHLGTLDYLDRINLLREVHTISSVSGGSLIAIGYALSLKKGETFQEFYDNLCEFIPEINTFEELLKILRNPNAPVASGCKTLITALAAVYRDNYFQKYYGDPKFGIFWESGPEIHLKELIFNATEFKTGVGFRFQTGQFGNLIGNSQISISDDFAKDIRMSDIMAASSCIPGGMEPLKFPQDFHWPDDPVPTSKFRPGKARPRCEQLESYLMENFGINDIPLMDGGVYDNQGITSIILTQARRYQGQCKQSDTLLNSESIDEPVRARSWAKWVLSAMEKASGVEKQKDMGEIDLFIVSDTPIYSDPMYAIPPRDKAKGLGQKISRLKLGTVYAVSWAVTVILAISAVVGISFITSGSDVVDNFTDIDLEQIPGWLETSVDFVHAFAMGTLILLVLLAISLLIGIRRIISKAVRKVVETMPPMSRSLWSYAKKLSLGEIWDMVTLRASSMSALTAKIFMHRVRQLGYSLLYSHHHFESRVMDNNINDTLHAEHNANVPDFVRDPSDDAEKIMKTAATMGTKLWVDKPKHEGDRDDLDILIASGHISTCFNIIEHLWEYHRDENGQIPEKFQPLFEQAKADWIKLNEDPFWLVNKREFVGKERGALFWKREKFKSRKKAS